MNTKRILQRALPAAAATALLFSLVPASYASAAASRTVSPQMCLYAASSVHPANCEGHAPAGIYWFQGRAFDGSYQYLNLTYGCSLYYPSYQGDYVVVPADN
jgi:hypothetical protein